jgi:hypothetical protein
MAAGFDRDDIGGHCAHGQSCLDPSDYVIAIDGAVQEQDIDELAGSAGITVGFAGRRPERVMSCGERPVPASCGQSARPWQRTGFGAQYFQVVIEIETLTAPGHDPLMASDHRPPVEDHHFRRPQRHPQLPADEKCRDRLFRHSHRDQR